MAGPVTRFGFSTVLGIQGPAGVPGPIGPPGQGAAPVFTSQIRNTVPSNLIGQSMQPTSGQATYTDQGGNLFAWDPTATDTDNGIDVFQVTGIATGRWRRQYDGFYRPEWFGAVGDLSHDDYTAIQTMFDTVPNGSTCVFRPGRIYRHLKGFNIDRGLTLKGSHGAFHFDLGQNNQAILFFDGDATGNAITITGRGATGEAITQVGNFYVIAMSGPNPRPVLVLSEHDCGAVDGATSASWHFKCNPQGTQPAAGNIWDFVASCGGIGNGAFPNNGGPYFAFRIYHDGTTGGVGVHLHTSTGDADFVTATAIPSTGLSDIEVNYDGTHVYVRINGVQDANSVTLSSGHIVQNVLETVCVGIMMSRFPLANSLTNTSSKGTDTLFGDLKISTGRTGHAFGAGPSTPNTTPSTVDSDHTTNCVVNFAPSFFKSGGSFIDLMSSKGAGRSTTGSPVEHYMHWIPSAPPPWGGNSGTVMIDGLNLFGNGGPTQSNGAIFIDALYVDIDHCVLQQNADKGITYANATYGHTVRRTNISCVYQVGGPGWSWNVGIARGAGAEIWFSDCNFQGGNFIIATDGGGIFERSFVLFPAKYAAIACIGDAAEGNALYVNNFHYDDEGTATQLAGLICVGMADLQTVACEFPGYGLSTCNMYQLGRNGNVRIGDTLARINPSSPGVVQVIAAPGRSGDAATPGFIEIAQPTKLQGSGGAVPILDPASIAGSTLVAPQLQSTEAAQNFTADADMTFAGDVPLYGMVIATDTGVHLTTGRNAIIPDRFNYKGKRAIFRNETAQTITFKGFTGTGFAVATTKSAMGRYDGTNWVRVTPDA